MSHWLDDVARQVAQGGVSRRSLLRRLGAGVVAGAVAALGRRGTRVAAQVTPTRRCLLAAAPNTTYGCLTGQTCCPTVDLQGVCCPAGTLCPPPGTVAGPLCAVCPAGTVICGTGTAATCCQPGQICNPPGNVIVGCCFPPGGPCTATTPQVCCSGVCLVSQGGMIINQCT